MAKLARRELGLNRLVLGILETIFEDQLDDLRDIGRDIAVEQARNAVSNFLHRRVDNVVKGWVRNGWSTTSIGGKTDVADKGAMYALVDDGIFRFAKFLPGHASDWVRDALEPTVVPAVMSRVTATDALAFIAGEIAVELENRAFEVIERLAV